MKRLWKKIMLLTRRWHLKKAGYDPYVIARHEAGHIISFAALHEDCWVYLRATLFQQANNAATVSHKFPVTFLADPDANHWHRLRLLAGMVAINCNDGADGDIQQHACLTDYAINCGHTKLTKQEIFEKDLELNKRFLNSATNEVDAISALLHEYGELSGTNESLRNLLRNARKKLPSDYPQPQRSSII